MAPIPTYLRTWCKTCQEWTLHHQPHRFDSVAEKIKFESHCKICDTVFTEAKFSEIPEEKILEQRRRYTASSEKENPISNILGLLIPENPFRSMEEAFAPKIIEEDAGQEAIDKQVAAAYWKKQKKEEEVQNKIKEEATRFKLLGRNDKCLCGSGKKYKACCMEKYANINSRILKS